MHHPELQARYATEAEQVRAWLVGLRGGAPFLSSEDARLLLSWLEADLPVTAVQAALDRVAARRRKKRVRTRLSLSIAAGEVKKLGARSVPRSSAAPPADRHGLAGLAAAVAAMEVPPAVQVARAGLAERLRGLAAQDLGADALASQATSACAEFHEAAWLALAAEHPALRAAARAELSALEGAVPQAVWRDLVEEAARDQLRRRWPLATARELWDRLVRS